VWGGEIKPLRDLSIVIVSWNVRDLLERCLISLRGCNEPGCEIIVVDNASSDGSPRLVRERFPHVRLIASESNLGFVRANNRGIAASTGRYILLLNPDTEVLDKPLAAMITYMDEHLDIGILGPKLLRPDGGVQPSRRRFPTLATAFLESTVLQQWCPRNRILQRYYMQDKDDDEEQDADWLVGACLLIRREAWNHVGPLDENIFMYSEELDWCRRAKMAGWRVVYVPWATVVHHEGQSSSQVVPARHIYFQSSKVYYFRKHHGTAAGETLRLFLLATYVFQLAVEAAKWLVGHKRALRQERVAAYIRVLRSGLHVQGEHGLTPTLPQGKRGQEGAP
jgi:N-acetylglucosaminyl-diphospho-decaprenol L-rhamnosyltransferase